jgi:hypothetical protein
VGGSGLGAEAGETAEEAMRFAQMDADGGGSVSFAELVRLCPLLTTRYSLLATRHSPLSPTYYSYLLLTTRDSQLTRCASGSGKSTWRSACSPASTCMRRSGRTPRVWQRAGRRQAERDATSSLELFSSPRDG